MEIENYNKSEERKNKIVFFSKGDKWMELADIAGWDGALSSPILYFEIH